ncbi:alpha-protein kinase 2 [Stigmatopora nigra]
MNTPEEFLPLLPHLSTTLISPTCEIYAQPILIPDTRPPFRVESINLENFRASNLSAEHTRTASPTRLDSLEDDFPTEPMSYLYIFEDETQDFILNPSKLDHNNDGAPIRFSDSAKSMTHSNTPDKAWLALASNSALEPFTELTQITPQRPRSVSPAEQWCDACQYLDNKDVLPASTSSDLSLEEPWVSGYATEGIGWEGDDTIGWRPPVERWSSVESWASALSDWNVIGTPAQEFTDTFSEIGAEIDTLTDALADIKTDDSGEGMGLQDQPVGGFIQEVSIQSEQGCFAFQSPIGDIVQSTGDLTAITSTQVEEMPVINLVHEKPAVVSSDEDIDSLNPAWTHLSDVDLPRFVQFLGTEKLKEEEIVLKIVEDEHVTEETAELTNEQEFGNKLSKVTKDDNIHQLDSPPNQETDLRSGSSNIEHSGTFAEEKMNLCMPMLNTSGNVQHNTLTEPELESQVCSQVSCPTFILPVAPLEIKSTLEYRRSSLEGDQLRTLNDAQPRIRTLWPLCDKARPSEEVQELCKEPPAILKMNCAIPDEPHAPNLAKMNNHLATSKLKQNQKTLEKPQLKTDAKKEKSTPHHHGLPSPKKQENLAHLPSGKQKETFENDNNQLVKETIPHLENAKPHGKKKKKHHHNATGTENDAKMKETKGRMEMSNIKVHKDAKMSDSVDKKTLKPPHGEHIRHNTDGKNKHVLTSDDTVKKRRLSKDKFAKFLDLKPKTEEGPKVDVRTPSKKASSEVVKPNTSPPVEEPKVMQPIQPESVSADPQSLSLCCKFSTIFTKHTITWRHEAVVLLEVKRSAGDETRASLTISNASHKDLGKYQCCLSSSHGCITLDYLLTYEVLREIVILPSPNITAPPVEAGFEAEDVQCSRLLFKEDFLSEQYFGENQPVSVVTEKAHFGEGMHRRAFRTRLRQGWVPLLLAGPSCVLKVHTAVTYGTKNNDDLVQRNFSLAVEECHVQNTAREYIKEYNVATQSVDAFGEVPDIIPIYLVHRPSSDIPYATLEEELIGDFVKYSVKDGKEINLMRRDSEAGRKCCAFQHWVYQRTEGNLLVTDMQGGWRKYPEFNKLVEFFQFFPMWCLLKAKLRVF